MPQWTQAQREAIDARNSELLVSAAAGSGKTADEITPMPVTHG